MIPDDPSCWMDTTWDIPCAIKNLKASGVLEVLLNRTRFHVSLEHTTRIAKVICGPQNGRTVGFLPLFTQFQEAPEDVEGFESLKMIKGGKLEVLVPVSFARSWFRTENGLLFSKLSGGPLPAVLSQSLASTQGEIDIIPLLEHIFGLSLYPLIVKRIPDFISRFMQTKVRGLKPSIEV